MSEIMALCVFERECENYVDLSFYTYHCPKYRYKIHYFTFTVIVFIVETMSLYVRTCLPDFTGTSNECSCHCKQHVGGRTEIVKSRNDSDSHPGNSKLFHLFPLVMPSWLMFLFS